jgi:hypothetical protein
VVQRLHHGWPLGDSDRLDNKEFFMSLRHTVFILALAAAGLSAANAQSTSTFVGGEIGFIDRPMQSTLTREAVRQQLQTFRSNPIAADGGQFVGGEMGYVFPQHGYARVNGQWVHTDRIAHNPKPSLNKTDAERRLFLEQYSPA